MGFQEPKVAPACFRQDQATRVAAGEETGFRLANPS